ncbi:hypothetical protein PR048_017194 [Dryococelus australis]|uniref:Reverse transcriptase domain-containing protein n=1 Tax=Dryococelus australis TaxID=614101 RepID=A0ABQ9H8X4_9NEOP|nr:hypothetical protein PR048_017194 [Dryococelus australis]
MLGANHHQCYVSARTFTEEYRHSVSSRDMELRDHFRRYRHRLYGINLGEVSLKIGNTARSSLSTLGAFVQPRRESWRRVPSPLPPRYTASSNSVVGLIPTPDTDLDGALPAPNIPSFPSPMITPQSLGGQQPRRTSSAPDILSFPSPSISPQSLDGQQSRQACSAPNTLSFPSSTHRANFNPRDTLAPRSTCIYAAAPTRPSSVVQQTSMGEDLCCSPPSPHSNDKTQHLTLHNCLLAGSGNKSRGSFLPDLYGKLYRDYKNKSHLIELPWFYGAGGARAGENSRASQASLSQIRNLHNVKSKRNLSKDQCWSTRVGDKVSARYSAHRVAVEGGGEGAQHEALCRREDEEEDEVERHLAAHVIAAGHGDESDEDYDERDPPELRCAAHKLLGGLVKREERHHGERQQQLDHQDGVHLPAGTQSSSDLVWPLPDPWEPRTGPARTWGSRRHRRTAGYRGTPALRAAGPGTGAAESGKAAVPGTVVAVLDKAAVPGTVVAVLDKAAVPGTVVAVLDKAAAPSTATAVPGTVPGDSWSTLEEVPVGRRTSNAAALKPTRHCLYAIHGNTIWSAQVDDDVCCMSRNVAFALEGRVRDYGFSAITHLLILSEHGSTEIQRHYQPTLQNHETVGWENEMFSQVGKESFTMRSFQLVNYFENNNLFMKMQYGFRKGKFTTTALLALRYSSSYVFDCVSHEILLDKLACYDISGIVLNALKPYLQVRKEIVSIMGEFSEALSLDCDVPQGSMLGPLLFLILVNDLQLNGCSLLFADDATLIAKGSDRDTVFQKSDEILEQIQIWFLTNKSRKNSEITLHISLTTEQQQTWGGGELGSYPRIPADPRLSLLRFTHAEVRTDPRPNPLSEARISVVEGRCANRPINRAPFLLNTWLQDSSGIRGDITGPSSDLRRQMAAIDQAKCREGML